MSSKGLPTWLKFVITIAVLLGIVGVLGGIGVWWAMASIENSLSSMEEELPLIAEEGVTYGTAHSQEECVKAGLERALTCGQFEISCMVTSGIFGTSCLDSAVPDPTLCEGVPSMNNPTEAGTWVAEECRRSGHPDSTQCSTFLQQTVLAYCTKQRS